MCHCCYVVCLQLDVRSNPQFRGVAIIIGNSYTRKNIAFSGNKRQLPPLPGSLVDAYKLRKALEHLQFFTVVKTNVTQAELLETLLSPLGHRFGRHPCHRFVFGFCGHGGNDHIFCEDERHVKFSVIVDIISNHQSLKNVPRLFFFDVSRNEGTGTQAEGRSWQSQISNITDVLVACSTSPGYEIFENDEGSVWLSMLANKMITCARGIHDVVMEANEELISMVQPKGFPRLQQPELLDKLDTNVNLLKESGGNFLKIVQINCMCGEYTVANNPGNLNCGDCFIRVFLWENIIVDAKLIDIIW